MATLRVIVIEQSQNRLEKIMSPDPAWASFLEESGPGLCQADGDKLGLRDDI
jgi:hypothetical protein